MNEPYDMDNWYDGDIPETDDEMYNLLDSGKIDEWDDAYFSLETD